MSVAILGGLDRLKRNYEKLGSERGIEVKFFHRKVPELDRRLMGVNGIILITGTISHTMITQALRVAKKYKIPITRNHSSSISSLKRCLSKLVLI
jgi:hypothetical protein